MGTEDGNKKLKNFIGGMLILIPIALIPFCIVLKFLELFGVIKILIFT